MRSYTHAAYGKKNFPPKELWSKFLKAEYTVSAQKQSLPLIN